MPLITFLVVAVAIVITLITTFFSLLPTTSSAATYETDYTTSVFNKDKVMDINIEISEENWDSLIQNALSEQYVNCDIIINGETFKEVGLRAKGNSSLSMVASDSTTDRFSFKVSFDKYIEGQNLYGLDKLVLNNMISDPTYMKEYLSYEIFAELDVPTPAYSFSNISINGKPWGLYLALEPIEESFIIRYYGSLSGNLYKPDGMEMGQAGGKGGARPPDMPNKDSERRQGQPNVLTSPQPTDDILSGTPNQPPSSISISDPDQSPNSIPTKAPDQPSNSIPTKGPNQSFGFKDMEMGSKGGANLVYTDDAPSSYTTVLDSTVFKTTSDSDKQKVIDMIKNLHCGTNLEEYLDIEEILKYFAANTFLVNLDSYASSMKHNYYLYEKDGIFQILPWDFNLSFGTFQTQNATSAINFPIDTPVTDSMENSPLIAKLLEVDEYKALYYDYLNEIAINYVKSGKYENTISKLNDLIGDYVKNDATAFYTYDDYTASLPHLIQFGKDRSNSIIAQINGEQPSDSYGTLETTVDLIKLGTQGPGKGDRKDTPPFSNQTDGNIESVPPNEDGAPPNMGGTLPSEDGIPPNMDGAPTNMDRIPPEFTNRSNTNYIPQLIMLGVYTFCLLVSTIFVSSIQRKKYSRK